MNDHDVSDTGQVRVHHKVLEEIVYMAVKNVDGIWMTKSGFGAGLGNWISGVKYPGIQVRLKGKNEVYVEVKVFVRYGLNIPMIARKIQDLVRTALERTTEVNVKDINVNVLGVDREG